MSDQPDNSEPDVNELAKSIVDRATENGDSLADAGAPKPDLQESDDAAK